ncbi:hypothetical protein D3C78_1593510 [compost metagenome]
MKSGIMMTGRGIIMVARIRTKKDSRPRKRIRASGKAARLARIRLSATAAIATRTELKK